MTEHWEAIVSSWGPDCEFHLPSNLIALELCYITLLYSLPPFTYSSSFIQHYPLPSSYQIILMRQEPGRDKCEDILAIDAGIGVEILLLLI
jgi:hypothetical protein